jgi:Ca2+-binding RTX toxin-like protein
MGIWTPGPGATPGDDTFTGDGTSETADGLAGNDTLIGNGGDDTLTGGEGDDVVIGGAGADDMTGDEGVDTLDYSASGAGVNIDFFNELASGGDAAGDTIDDSFERIIGSAFNDVLTGDNTPNTLIGGAGDDLIQGRGASDILDGGAGIDTVSFANMGAPFPAGTNNGAIVDLAIVGVAQDTNVGLDVLTGFENLTGSTFDDTLHGDSGANIIVGLTGDDTMNGRDGDDVLSGLAGADTMSGGAGVDTLE